VANSTGRFLLILSGMVLDVTRWLSSHPGGSQIIPAQALNVDCARFFEVSSGQGYVILIFFLIWESVPSDWSKENAKPKQAVSITCKTG
jgi:hypothetical protein